MEKKPKTIRIPDEPVKSEPAFAFVGADEEGRDVTKPIGYDERGRPLFAPRGVVLRFGSSYRRVTGR